jgi:septal ring factor EnvC (AmiA/AmiB activator)
VLAELEPAKFFSSASYLLVLGENKAIRRSLRQSDDVIKDALASHETLEQQYKRVATDINTIQEQFIRIDSALFED